jgi:hypothetical protein
MNSEPLARRLYLLSIGLIAFWFIFFSRGVFDAWLSWNHPLPYHLVALVLLAVNCWLLYRVCVRLSGRSEVGVLAVAAVTGPRRDVLALLQHRRDL